MWCCTCAQETCRKMYALVLFGVTPNGKQHSHPSIVKQKYKLDFIFKREYYKAMKINDCCWESNIVYKHNIDKEERHMLINTMKFLHKFEKLGTYSKCDTTIKENKQVINIKCFCLLCLFMPNPYFHVYIMHNPIMHDKY